MMMVVRRSSSRAVAAEEMRFDLIYECDPVDNSQRQETWPYGVHLRTRTYVQPFKLPFNSI